MLTKEPSDRLSHSMSHARDTALAREQPSEPALPEPGPEPDREPDPAPWHDPGPPVREIDLPPNTPARGIPVENPEAPRREPSP